MGQLPKSKIEQLKREKREAKAAKKRKVATRDKIVRFLIVCEGERTEPNYFKELVKDRYSEVRSEEIVGEGRSTCALVKKTEEIQEKLERQRQLNFDRVWVVFDRDDFNDFNEAITMARQKGYNVGWTNEAFELWYLLHFIYLDSAVSRAHYIAKLESEIRRNDEYKDFRYRKNDKGIYALLQKIGNENHAKVRAKKLRGFFEHSRDYKMHKPCTTVDLLVEELEHPEVILNSWNK
ncbi:MAG: RloB family protein [Muribaculaceae bacterium]|nr:RloB family protein [Muribaculaceae bacterium]